MSSKRKVEDGSGEGSEQTNPLVQAILKVSPAELHHGAFIVDLGGTKKLAYLAGADDAFPHIDQITDESHISKTPSFQGNPDEFIEKHSEDQRVTLARQMKNKVKKCACGKPVAFTLSTCNACGADLSNTPISYTNNVFTGFIYGIAKGPFPLTISIRAQTETSLVFDDLLALTPLHLNTIPTDSYLPDWRYLLKEPSKGLVILEGLFENCWKVAKSQFLSNREWRQTVLRDSDGLSEDELRRYVAAGFNYPPSQYQLHLQWMLFPLLPHHYLLYQQGVHFTPGRFIPFDYAHKVLSLNIPYPKLDDSTPLEDIFTFYKSKGVDYNKIHAEFYEAAGEAHRRLANWNPKHFKGIVVDDTFVESHGLANDDLESLSLEDLKALHFKLSKATVVGAERAFFIKHITKLRQSEASPKVSEEHVDVKRLVVLDKELLQNYGRPYVNGKPTGSFYRFPKSVTDVQPW